MTERAVLTMVCEDFKVRTSDAGGRLCILIADHDPWRGSPLHIHRDADEWFYNLGCIRELLSIACGRTFRVGCAMAGAKAQSLTVRLRPD